MRAARKAWSAMISGPMRRAAFLCLLAGGCAIAFAPIFVRLASPEVGPVASAFWRTALAAPLLWIWLLASEHRGRTPDPAKAKPGVRSQPLVSLALAGL